MPHFFGPYSNHERRQPSALPHHTARKQWVRTEKSGRCRAGVPAVLLHTDHPICTRMSLRCTVDARTHKADTRGVAVELAAGAPERRLSGYARAESTDSPTSSRQKRMTLPRKRSDISAAQFDARLLTKRRSRTDARLSLPRKCPSVFGGRKKCGRP